MTIINCKYGLDGRICKHRGENGVCTRNTITILQYMDTALPYCSDVDEEEYVKGCRGWVPPEYFIDGKWHCIEITSEGVWVDGVKVTPKEVEQ
jgi:hypothetical protein